MKIPRYWRNTSFYYRLAGWRCINCGTFHMTKPATCKKCGAKEFREVELPKRGKLLAYTVLKTPPKDLEEQVPYMIGLVELDDGTRILTQIVDAQVGELKPGTRVEAAFRKIWGKEDSGIIEYGYKFRPAIQEETS